MADRNIPSNSDAAYGSVVTHLHFDGADGSTTFTDQKGKVYVPSGDAKLSTVSPKFGTASMLCDGVGDFITTTSDLSDFQFGSGDFTVEAWVKVSPLVSDRVLFDYYQTGAANCWELYVDSGGNPQWWTTNGGGGVLVLGASGGPINTGSWVHVAVCRVLTALAIYVDGVLKGTATDTRDYSASLAGFSIGAQVNSRTGSYDWNGEIDEVRITKGVARYVTDFTPSAIPFDDTPYLLAQTLDGVSQTAEGTVSTGADRSFSSAQALDGVGQIATAGISISASASQSVSGVTQTASATSAVSAAGTQTLAGVTQSASGTTGGVDRTFAAAQVLDTVVQTAATAAFVKGSGAQILASVLQGATAATRVSASASQVLAGVTGFATAKNIVSLTGAKTLDGVSQIAAATVTETVRSFLAVQVLSVVSQSARLRHEYIFERNERTRDVQAEWRGIAIAAEDRAFEVQPEARGAAVAPERRRIAFTD